MLPYQEIARARRIAIIMLVTIIPHITLLLLTLPSPKIGLVAEQRLATTVVDAVKSRKLDATRISTSDPLLG